MSTNNRKLNRLKDYDYSKEGYYFVTICVKDRLELFGQIVNKEIHLYKTGEIVNQCWIEIPLHFPNVKLDEFIVMPNHVHGIIIIDNAVGNRHACSLRRQYQKLPVVIGSYKSGVTKSINELMPHKQFQWQKSYHDHIIRDEQSLKKIRDYIHDNPLKWDLDKYKN